MADKELSEHVTKMLMTWGLEEEDFLEEKPRKWTKSLKITAREIRITNFMKTYNKTNNCGNIPTTETGTIWNKLKMTSTQISTLVQLRHSLICGNREWEILCIHCLDQSPNNLRHILLRCNEKTLREVRKKEVLPLDGNDKDIWNSLNNNTIAEITEGTEDNVKILKTIFKLYNTWILHRLDS